MRRIPTTIFATQVRHLSWMSGVIIILALSGPPIAMGQPDGGRYNDLGAIHDANQKKGIGVVRASEEIVPGGEVAPVDMAKVKASDFADHELDMPYYLANFHRVANAVPLGGERRGWIEVSVWRGNSNQRTYNARVLESQLSLAYFYTAKRPWNQYYGDPAVRARLEAMLERWCNMQDGSGKFSEYAEGRWGLAPTAFATKFTGQTLAVLKDGPPIDPALHRRVEEGMRKALMATFTDADLWEHGRSYSNQYSNAFAGGLAWLSMHPDDNELRENMMRRMTDSAKELQSPAGYFYERDGADWGYNLSTHHSNLHVMYHYARGTEFEPLVLEEVKRFYDWMKWNAVIEPDRSGYALNRAIETRQRKGWLHVDNAPGGRNHSEIPAAEKVEMARAFLPSREELARERAAERAELERQWPNVPAMEAGNFRAFTPYAFLHRDLTHWFPTEEEQDAAQAKLPYLREGRFAHLRADNRMKAYYLFVRRPGYYVAFNGGERFEDSQRLGIGLVWSAEAGTLAQSQSRSATVWGTTAGNADNAFEAGSTTATISVGGKLVDATPGAKDLGEGDLTVSYPLGEQGKKTIRFEDGRMGVEVELAGTIRETVPVTVKEGDTLKAEGSRVVLMRGGKQAMAIEFAEGTKIEVGEPAGERIGPYRVAAVRATGEGGLNYRVVFGGANP